MQLNRKAAAGILSCDQFIHERVSTTSHDVNSDFYEHKIHIEDKNPLKSGPNLPTYIFKVFSAQHTVDIKTGM